MLRYAVTPDLQTLPSCGPTPSFLVAQCAELSHDGLDFLLIREKHMTTRELTSLAQNILKATKLGGAMQVLIARRADIAVATGAQGVHLSAHPGELSVSEVRRVFERLGREAFISVACHALGDVQRAREEGASAILFAPVFGKNVDGVEVVPGVGLDALRAACSEAGEIPVFALGGVTSANAAECVRAGAKGVAGIRMFFARSS